MTTINIHNTMVKPHFEFEATIIYSLSKKKSLHKEKIKNNFEKCIDLNN